MSRPVIPVILSGGSGTRIWPLSRADRPKQFLSLVSERTLFQDTLLRLAAVPGIAAPIVVCNADHRFLVAEQLRDINVLAAGIVLEPEGRNTAPAVAVAALLALSGAAEANRQGHAGDDPILLVLPADHVIRDTEALVVAVEAAVAAASSGRLVTFGVVPDKPETGYGYIKCGAPEKAWLLLDEFVEKPNLATAETYLESGDYLWNSGMFVFAAGTFLAELGACAPEILVACERAVRGARVDEDFTRLGLDFLESPSDSIDYAVMEKTKNAAVVRLSAGWNDVGSWSALYEVLDKDSNNNILRGDVLEEYCRDSYIESSSRLVAAIGLSGVVVVETADAVLVMNKAETQQVKLAVDALKAAGRAEVGAPKPKLN